jgi:glycosyltransferase involved in cell wall biosynthesis
LASQDLIGKMVSPTTVGIVAGQLVVGGAERQLYLWLSNLDRDRFRPVVVTLHPDFGDYWEDPIESLEIPLLRVPRRRNRLSRLGTLVGLLRPFRPKLLHGWHLFASPYAGAAGRLLRARASLGSLRGSYGAYRLNRTEALLTEWLTDGLLVNSHAAAAKFEGSGAGRSRKVFVVPNAVENDVADRAAARSRLAQRWGIDTSRVWIASMGRFDQGKRFDLLLDVVAALCSKGHDVQFVLIGYGDRMEALRGQVQVLGLADRVLVAGPDPDARRWLSAFDLFCFPSTDEGLPNVVMEAAVAGVPVVGWRTDFLEELLGKEATTLAEIGDAHALEGVLAALIADPRERDRAAREGRGRMLANFGVPRFVAALTAVYAELLDPNGAQGA